MKLIRKYSDLGPSTLLWGKSVVHRDPGFTQLPELLKLGVVVPYSDSYKEFLDPEEWNDVEVPEGYSIFLFPKDIWEDWKKMSDLLIEKGIITNPPYIIGNPDITYKEFFDCPTSIFYHHNRELEKIGRGEFNKVFIDVDLAACPKIEGKELTIRGSKIESSGDFDQFLGYIYDPKEEVKTFIEENGLVLKSESTSDGTIMGFKLVWIEVEKTYEEQLREYRLNGTKIHIFMPPKRMKFNPETKFLYALVISKQKNKHLSEFFVQDPETWNINNFNSETQALIEIPLSYVGLMNIPEFIMEKGIKN